MSCYEIHNRRHVLAAVMLLLTWSSSMAFSVAPTLSHMSRCPHRLSLSTENSGNERNLRFSRDTGRQDKDYMEDNKVDETDKYDPTPILSKDQLFSKIKDAAKNQNGWLSRYTSQLQILERPHKSQEEIEASRETARNLNGVNPLEALVGSALALVLTEGFWHMTQEMGVYFALHQVESHIYIVQRTSAVVRNVIMGFLALGSGFCGVTALGLFLLSLRVAFGVVTGELDPTTIPHEKTKKSIDFSDAWDLMFQKRRRHDNEKKGSKI